MISLGILQNDTDGLCHELHVLLLEAAARNCGRTESDAAGNEGRLGIVRNRIFINRDINFLEQSLGFLTGHSDVLLFPKYVT